VTPRARRRGSPDAPGRLGGEQVEGLQAVRELLVAGRRPVHEVLVAAGRDGAGPVRELLALAGAAGVPVRRVGAPELARRARSEAHQGVVALAAPLVPAPLADLAAPGERGDPPFLVVLDSVTDPGNLGAVLRSALCAGATGAVLARRRGAHVTPSAAKAAAGAVEHLPIALVAGIPAALRALRAAGVWVVGLDASGDRSLWDVEVLAEPLAVVLGAEGRGLAPLTRARCDLLVRIPLAGPIPSLNVAAAAAIACFEAARRRGGARGDGPHAEAAGRRADPPRSLPRPSRGVRSV